MVEAPEKIWADSYGVWHSHDYSEILPCVEYVRADLVTHTVDENILLERQIAELRAEVERIHELYGFEQRGRLAAEAENARLRALPLKDEVERVLEKLTTTNPSAVAKDYDAARTLLSRLRAGEQEGWRHGPYGYLIKPIGLNEEHWHLAIEPSAYPDEEVSVPLYADQDQFPAAPSEQGGDRG